VANVKVKVVNNGLDQNLNGTNFNNIPSETIFSFGKFNVTSNFDGRNYIDYTNTLSSFVRGVTLETLNINSIQSKVIHEDSINAVLNLDDSDLNSFVRFGSAYEYLRISVEKIVNTYPYSLFIDSQKSGNVGLTTFFDYTYDLLSNSSTFKIPVGSINNIHDLVYNYGNTGVPSENGLKNLNISYNKYVVWTSLNPQNNGSIILGFTGYTANSPNQYLIIRALGNPFYMVSGGTGKLSFHLKPNNLIFEEYRSLLNEYEKYMLATRNGTTSFNFTLKDPTLLDDGTITYFNSVMSWTTSDGYNIDINTPNYRRFLEIILTIGAKYDKVKTDLIARFLTPASLRSYDLTGEEKMGKLLRIYGAEFDQMRKFIDSLTYINTVTYDKINNIPDQLVQNLSRTFGWNYFSLVNESELVNSFFTVHENERNLNEDLLPAEINIELWRRILINTNYFWKSKGTREGIKSILLLIGIPEPFINITEYVYTVDGKINPNTVNLSKYDFPTNTLPYDNSGYPVAPLEAPNFYFQISGDTDNGQAYMNVFRKAGFNLNKTIDNKKSWIQAGATYRVDDTTPQYYQEDSKLVLNTKEVDVALDTARGIEYDVYDYILKDFAINSSGYTLPFSYVNISLGVGAEDYTFQMPEKAQGDFEVRYNGILLNAPKSGTTSGFTTGVTTGITGQSDYTINYSANTFTLTNPAINIGNRRDVIQATYVFSGTTTRTGITTTVQYVVSRVKASSNGTLIPLPTMPRGDVQVTINGIALTKGTPQFTADYIVDPNNTTGSSQIIIQNQDVIAYLSETQNSMVQVAYVVVENSNDITARSEIVRVDSLNSGKIYFNQSANKYVYKLNYKANSATNIKILIDGIALEPNTDYVINVLNKYEVFLPKGIKYGSVISVYYLVGTDEVFKPVVENVFGIGDISKLSFLEFMELIQRRMINARNRKIISDFRGGWYPSLERIYVEYMKRSLLPENDPLHSNGYTFANLYPFLSKYNAFFQKFVDQMLSATIILNHGGLLVRNSVFTKQKYMYRRGVNMYSGDSTIIDSRGNPMLRYLGDDGSVFLITQPQPEPPLNLFVRTITGTIGSIITGGYDVSGNTLLTEYGVMYRKIDDVSWLSVTTYGSLSTTSFPTIISEIADGNVYEYAAYVKSGQYGYTGDTLQISIPVAPEIETTMGIAGVGEINSTGAYNINVYTNVQKYGMQYKKVSESTWETTSLKIGPLSVAAYSFNITGLSVNTAYNYRAYIEVSGIPYYGQSLVTSTLPLPTAIPNVSTGIAANVTSNSMRITGSSITNKNNLPVMEYGILYSNSSSVALTYGGVGVIKVSFSNDIGVNINYFTGSTGIMNGLPPNTTTYYRAFAKNSIGVGYGVTKTQQTLPLTNQVVSFNYAVLTTDTPITTIACAKPYIFPVLTAGQSFRLHYADHSLSLSELPTSYAMSACALRCTNTSEYDVSMSSLPDTVSQIPPYSSTGGDSGYVDINSSTDLNNITFYAIARSKAGNLSIDVCNCANVQFTSISNQIGGSFVLGDPASICIGVYSGNINNGGVGGGELPLVD
jgi:hypothetical protein